MEKNQFQILPFFIISFSILISGFTVIFTWSDFLILLLDYVVQIKPIFPMNTASIGVITVVLTLSFYLLFLLLGVGGIANNRAAQGLNQNQKKWSITDLENIWWSILYCKIDILNLFLSDKYLLEFYFFEVIRQYMFDIFDLFCRYF